MRAALPHTEIDLAELAELRKELDELIRLRNLAKECGFPDLAAALDADISLGEAALRVLPPLAAGARGCG